MKNKYNFIAAAALLTSSLFAQQQRPIIPCYTDEAIKHYRLTHPKEAALDDIERSKSTVTPEYAARQSGGNTVQSPTPYVLDTIPIVFHILHQGGTENVSDAVIRQAVAEINRVYTKSTSDSASIDPYMAPYEGKVNYIFQLATKDPSGNCTNGITRHFDTNTDWDQSTYANYIYTWNRAKYVNVYIVREICSGGAPCSQSGGIIVGYTNGIGGTGTASIDAIVYNSSFLTGANARSLAHELGHHLSLPHTFGATNTPGTCLSGGMSDDFLATANPAAATTGVTDDTPKYAGAFSTCPPGSPNACDVSNHANVQNIMDYSSCPLNFTNGQAKRIHNLLGSTYASRSTLISAANKVAVGLRNPAVCVPVANFHASTLIACTGAPITFSDSSANATVTSWNWSFPGGTFVGGTTATDSMPKVSYAVAGTYAVSYTAATSAGSNSITKTSYVTINSNVATYGAYVESFESATVPGTDWAVSNNASTDWAINTTAAATGTKCVYIDNFSNTANNVSHLISPSYNISGFTTPKFSFRMAYQQQVSTNTDKLQVLSSTDCEATWTSRFARTGSALANVTPPSGFPLAPTPAQFATYTVNIGALAGSTNVRFKFDFTAGAGGPGNYIFIDDINVYDAAVGIEAFETKIGLDIYPNPSSGVVNIDFALNEKHNVAISVTDLLGRTVESISSKQYPVGDVKLAIAEKTTYAPGVYLVNLNIDGNMISKKIVIK
jgi:PKD repeat protein